MLARIAKLRLLVSRIFGLTIIFLILFTSHSFEQGRVVDILFEMSGLLLLSICSFGRLWALIFISGYKSDVLITEGPYSIIRHPLYFFSLIGAFGLGLASENVLVLFLIVVFYLFYYPFAILAEEKKLTAKFGQDYVEYMKRTPRLLPKFSLYKEPQSYNVTIKKLVRNFAEAMLFIWAFILMHFVEMLQDSGVLPVFWRVP